MSHRWAAVTTVRQPVEKGGVGGGDAMNAPQLRCWTARARALMNVFIYVQGAGLVSRAARYI